MHRHRASGHFGRRGLRALVIGAFLAVTVPAAAVGATTIGGETFSGTTVTSPFWQSGGVGSTLAGWPGKGCLTAGTDTAATPVPGCNLGSPDADGSGVARLTPSDFSRAGYLLFNDPLPINYGLDITFHQAQYGGSGADGISFFIVDGAVELERPGFFGGALGYATYTPGGISGVAGGLLGIGLDVYGNFASSEVDGYGCSRAPGNRPNRVTVRGPGNGLDGYCYIASSDTVSLRGADRAASDRLVRVLIDPDTTDDPKVTIFLDGTQVLQIPVPQAYRDAASFKFGFSGGTGSLTDVHEIWGLNIASVNPLPPIGISVLAEGYDPGTEFTVSLECTAPVISGTPPTTTQQFTFVSDGDGEATPVGASEAAITGPATCTLVQPTAPPGTAETTYECLEQQIGESRCSAATPQPTPVTFAADATDPTLVTMVVMNVHEPKPVSPSFTG